MRLRFFTPGREGHCDYLPQDKWKVESGSIVSGDTTVAIYGFGLWRLADGTKFTNWEVVE